MTHADTARQRSAQLGTQPAPRAVRRVRSWLAVAALALGLASLGSADGAHRAPDDAVALTTADAAQMTQQPPPIIWALDKDGDGVTDYYNPTHGPVRGLDAFGYGHFGARRDAGARKHQGVDYVIAPGAAVHSPISGEVARLGYAYRGAGGFRLVEIVNSETKVKARVLYVAPSVKPGDVVVAGQEIGTAQDLNKRYPGITNHVHVELRGARQQLIDATEALPTPAARQPQRRLAGRPTL